MEAVKTDQVLHLVYGAALGRNSWSATLEAIACALGARFASLWAYPRTGDRLCMPGQDELIEAYFAEEWEKRCPREQVVATLGDPRFSSGVVTDDLARSFDPLAFREFALDFQARHGLGDCATSKISIDRGHNAMLVIDRFAGAAAFSPEELRAIASISEHLGLSMAIADRVMGAAHEATAWRIALEEAGVAAVFLARDGSVLATTEPAERLFCDAFRVVGRRLESRVPEGQAAIETVTAARQRSHALLTVPRGEGYRPLIGRAIPIDAVEPSPAWMFSHVPVDTILVIADPEPEAHRAGTVEVLTRLGLSPAEAQVAALVGAGAAPVQVAEALALAETTVRSYLREAYSKLDISRQGQLSVLVNQIRSICPPDTRLRLS
ncbi:MAG: hypothetical protein KIS96_02685 [Bauldia sp.]|nr:hypothetical protein [Bauldia sp.]